MKNSTLIIFLLSVVSLAQIPSNYYNSANGLTGYALKTELSTIISTNYNGQSYGSLISLYQTSDNDEYYLNQGEAITNQAVTILDLYSENPNGQDPYNYIFSDNCGNVGNTEGVCYNREHIYPQGFFSSTQNSTPRNDAHHVIPTDGRVNGLRGSFPFGVVNPNGANVTTTQNGSKLGPSITTGFTGTVFEPIDEFKGDIARMLLYFATRYQSNINDSGWDAPNASANNPRDGSSDRFYEQWYIDLLLAWHTQDPVSQREIDRNVAIYSHQNNANPYIDNPQYVNMIWTASNNPAGSIFATLDATFIDVDMDGFGSVGDQITYEYKINNIGTTNLFNIRAVADFGSFATPGQLPTLPAGTTSTDPFGALTYTLTSSDVSSSCLCVINKIVVTAGFNSAGSNGSFSIESDDPDNFANVDGNGDMLPDDDTRTTFTVSNVSGNATDLFISEYIEGSGSDNKAIEIANYTGGSIDLSSYSLQLAVNGNTWSETLNLSGMLADQTVYVIARSNAIASITSQADLTTGTNNVLNFNGNDAVGLFNNGVLVDIVGVLGSSADFAKDETLVRKPSVFSPNTTFDKTAEWNVFPQNDATDLGMHTFGNTAGNTGVDLQSVVLYPNPSKGTFLINRSKDQIDQIQVYDLSGRELKTYITNNRFTISTSGIFIVRLIAADQVKNIKVIVN